MKHLFLLLFQCCPILLLAQKMPDDGTSQVRINDTDRTIRAGILAVTSAPKARPDRQYYWYGSGGIHQLQGGYSGHLLNGSYQEYYLNKNLRTEGAFDEGLKDGVWKDWSEGGKLSRLITWDQGEQTGPFRLYDPEGKVITSGNYKHNLLDGAVTFHIGTDSAKTLRYKKGQVMPPKNGNFLKRIHIFKKQQAPPAKPAP
jgi:hypothetical protein